jgi:hypothetical protein
MLPVAGTLLDATGMGQRIESAVPGGRFAVSLLGGTPSLQQQQQQPNSMAGRLAASALGGAADAVGDTLIF